MPSGSFEVETYTVFTSQSGGGGSFRLLALSSTPLAHGIRVKASLYYMSGTPADPGWVYNVDQPNFNGHTVYAYAPMADFRDVYDILRNEKPVNVSYFYDGPEFDPSKAWRKLFHLQLYTGLPEPPGEGPRDMSPP